MMRMMMMRTLDDPVVDDGHGIVAAEVFLDGF